MRAQPDTARVEALLLRIHRWLLVSLWAVGAFFVLRYRSEAAVVGPYTMRYLLGVLVPFALIAPCLAFESRLPRLCVSAWARRTIAVTTSLAAVGAALYALRVSDEFASLLLLVLVPALLAQVWARVAGTAAVLPAPAFLVVGALLLLTAEIPPLVTGSPLVVWGDSTTFATMFAHEAPFFDKGGRLRPRLDVLMRSRDYPRGARLATNSVGFRNREEFAEGPAPGTLRVLSLGDSFSTGYCADQDAFFGPLLQARLGKPAVVMNAEVSDPAYGLAYLQQHGVRYRPQVIVYGLSGNDVMQAEQFYGDDRLFRLDPEGRLERNPGFNPGVGSAWERFADFAYPVAGRPMTETPALAGRLATKLARLRLLSGLMASAARDAGPPVPMPGYAEAAERADGRKRLIDGASNLGFFYKGTHPPIEQSYRAFSEVLAAMGRTAASVNARLLLVVHPQRYQVQPADWKAMVERWSLDPNDFDLRLYDRRIAQIAGQAGVPLCDLIDAFASAAPQGGLYLPGGDMHFNRRGHEVAAQAAARCLVELPAN